MILLDLNNPVFQQDLFALSKTEQVAVLKVLKKISQLSWTQLYQDKGLRWERIHSRRGPDGAALYSLRITRKCRAVALRSDAFLRLLSLHPAHDSAYS